MSLPQTQIKFDIVGSFLPPEPLVRADADLAEGKITAAQYRHIQDDAVRDVIHRQLDAGLPFITSGELRRHHRRRDFYFGLNGITREYVNSGHLYQPTDAFTDEVRICDRIAYNPEHPFFDDFTFLCGCVGNPAICRQTLPSPTSLYAFILTLSDGMPERIYPEPSRLIDDIAEAYRLTIRRFYDLGCRSLLIDDTVFGRLCDRLYTKRILQGGVDLLHLHEDLIILFNLALEEIPSDMNIIAYLSDHDSIIPKWNEAEAHDNIIPKALAGLEADSFMLPFDVNDLDSLSVLRHVSPDKHVTLGLTSALTPAVDNADAISRAIDTAAHYIPIGLLSVSPVSGFRVKTGSCNGLTYDDQWRKLRALTELVGTL